MACDGTSSSCSATLFSVIFFFKQKTSYELRISDWSSDVCSSDLLTATPVEFVARNTYQLFECGPQDPTANYPLERAIEERWLVPYEVYDYTTKFLRPGITYRQLTEAQRAALEEAG